ncbi:UNC93-like protein [Periplaneta americana]|uniref:UNC93-like protein n=1 Tax=Periplaneta americana TaxID=6978 RepID=UPI0037E72502
MTVRIDNREEAMEMEVRAGGYVNHAFVPGEDVEPIQTQQPAPSVSPEVESSPEEKSRIVRNVVMLSIAFMFNFTTKVGTVNLQSSLNPTDGLGTASLVAIYVGLVTSNATLPTIVLRWVGCKWTVILTFLLMTPYIAFQYHTSFYSLVPASFLAGVVGAPLGVAANKYLAVTAEVYSEITGTPLEVVIPRFFGFFLLMCQGSQVLGNLITSAVITSIEPPLNETAERLALGTCGIAFCPGDGVQLNPNFRRPDEGTILLIIFIFSGALIASIVTMVLGVDSLRRYSEDDRDSSATGLSGFRLLVVTFRQLFRERFLQLLVPLTFWLGLEQAFMIADFTEAYVSCAWGLGDIGYVMVAHGVSNAAFSLLIGWLVKHTGRLLAMLLAFVVHVCVIITLQVWAPDPSQPTVFFVLAVLWGFCDAIWVVQIISLYSILSSGNEEAAFSNYDLWLSLGFIVGFSYSAVLCTRIKLHILLGLLVVGVTSYIVLEWKRYSQKRAKSTEDNTSGK